MIELIVRRIHLDYNVIAFPLLFVAKEMRLSNSVMDISVEECAARMLKVVDVATMETHGGKIFTHEGKQLPSSW
jgi:hypothetical protein